MEGTRRDPRNLCADLLRIRWKDAGGAIHKEYACLEDISEGGLCLKLDRHLDSGTWVSILYPKGRFEGRIKYCKAEGDGYLLGIEFLPGYRWTRRDYDPPHLLQFRLKIARSSSKRAPAGTRKRKTLC